MDDGVNPKLPEFVIALWKEAMLNPHKTKGLLSQRINRSLSSKKRRVFQDWVIEGTRWPRLWQQLLDEGKLEMDQFFERLKEYKKELDAKIENNPLESADVIAKQLDYPLWLVQTIEREVGLLQTARICKKLNERAEVFIRANVYRKSFEEIQDLLKQEKIDFSKSTLSRWGLKINHPIHVPNMEAYQRGLVEIQDDSSQFVIDHMDIGKNDQVMDGCARTGGKTLALANVLGHNHVYYVADTDARVFEELERRCKRAKLKNISKHWIAPDEANPLTRFLNYFDHVLVDAPCSSIGTIKRRPWLKHQIKKEQLDELQVLQGSILSRQSAWVKKGGFLTYSTCSFLKQENEEVIEKFLVNHPSFTIQKSTKLYPDQIESDGFYICTLQRV